MPARPSAARAISTAAKPALRSNAELSELLARLQDIPTLPAVAIRVTELINDPTSSSGEIAAILRKDQVLTAKILRLVNSSYYAIPGGVNDVQRALAFLGFNTLAQLVLGLSVFSAFPAKGDEEFSLVEFWRHALATAVCAEVLARRLRMAKPEEAFTCGLLHDIGKLVLHEIDPVRLRGIVTEASRRSCSFAEVEREADFPGHAFLGEAIATKWGLPQAIRLAIRYHHQDVSQLTSVLASAKPMIHTVRLANQLVVRNRIGNSGDHSAGEVQPEMLRPLGLSAGDIPAIEAELSEKMEKAGAFTSAFR